MLQWDALLVVGLPDALVDELIRHAGAHVRAALGANQVQHHVDRRRAAGTRVTPAIDREYAPAHRDPGKLVRQRGQVFPVDAAAIAVEQAGGGKQLAPRADGAERDPLLVDRLEPADDRLVVVALDPPPAADDDDIEIAQGVLVRKTAVGGDLQAAAGPYRAPVRRDRPPVITVLATDPVGHSQGFDCR